MKFHHILTVTGLVYYMFKKSKQFYIVYAIGLTEFTNPFLQARWFLKHYGMREGTTFKIIESLLIVMFFAIRIVVLTIYLYDAFTSKEMDFHPDDLIFSALGLSCIDYYYFLNFTILFFLQVFLLDTLYRFKCLTISFIK